MVGANLQVGDRPAPATGWGATDGAAACSVEHQVGGAWRAFAVDDEAVRVSLHPTEVAGVVAVEEYFSACALRPKATCGV